MNDEDLYNEFKKDIDETLNTYLKTPEKKPKFFDIKQKLINKKIKDFKKNPEKFRELMNKEIIKQLKIDIKKTPYKRDAYFIIFKNNEFQKKKYIKKGEKYFIE